MTPRGGVASDQLDPSLFVTMTEATCPPSSPTATQVVEIGAHETALTFASGLKLAVVCHVGVTPEAGNGDIWIPRHMTRTSVIANPTTKPVTRRTARTASSLQYSELPRAVN